jgi:hypothetical protein
VSIFNYSIVSSGGTKTGFARAHVYAEQSSYFTKQITIIDNYLEWTPIVISDILFYTPISIV